MKRIKLFEEFREDLEPINEIGEGSQPFRWSVRGGNSVKKWINEMAAADKSSMGSGYETLWPLMYEFKSPNATYVARISGGYAKHSYLRLYANAPIEQEYNVVIIVSFDLEGRDDTILTNFGEQFRVLSTVTSIAESVVKELDGVKWVKLQEIRIAPKLEDSETGTPIAQSKRGRLYLEYIKKQGKRLPGDWTAFIDDEIFVIKRGKWSGGRGINL